MCLRQEVGAGCSITAVVDAETVPHLQRLNRRQENHDEAKLKRDLTKQKWKAIDDES